MFPLTVIRLVTGADRITQVQLGFGTMKIRLSKGRCAGGCLFLVVFFQSNGVACVWFNSTICSGFKSRKNKVV